MSPADFVRMVATAEPQGQDAKAVIEVWQTYARKIQREGRPFPVASQPLVPSFDPGCVS